MIATGQTDVISNAIDFVKAEINSARQRCPGTPRQYDRVTPEPLAIVNKLVPPPGVARRTAITEGAIYAK